MKNIKRINPISLYILSALCSIALLFLIIILPTKASAATIGFVNADCLNVRTGPGTEHACVGQIALQNVVIYGSAVDSQGRVWYQIDYNGAKCYICGDWVENVHEETTDSSVDASFEEQLAQFPESYHSYLRNIHNSYPNYSFIPDYLSISFDDAVYQETLNHRKLVDLSSDGVSWRSLASSAYNRSNGTWYSYAGGWTDASIDVIEYFMDPRNFLNTNYMYIFAKQTYSSNESIELVKKIVASTFMSGSYTDSTGTHTYAETILQAGKDSGVSAYVIAAILAQEQGAYLNALCDGSRGAYNFFNDGANGSTTADVINNGIAFAKARGWTTVYASIVGGANIYKAEYISQSQDTYFYKDYNLINRNFNHQYAQSVYDQLGNGWFLSSALKGDRGGYVTLRIPVYTTMPTTAAPSPAENSSLSPRYDSNGNAKARTTSTSEMKPAGNVEPSQTQTQTSTTTSSLSKGDVNGDGKVSPADYVLVKNHITGKSKISDSAKLSAADYNGDGKVSPADYVLIKNKILGR